MSNLFKFAENILNNLDQSAQSSIAGALQKNTPTNKSNKLDGQQKGKHLKNNSVASSGFQVENERSKTPTTVLTTSSSYANFQQNLGVPSLGNKNSSAKSSTVSIDSWAVKAASKKDDELIEFLNQTNVNDFNNSFEKQASRTNLDKTDNLGLIFF